MRRADPADETEPVDGRETDRPALPSRIASRRGTTALWGVALGVSLVGYALADELIHFGWHLTYGTAAGLVIGAAVARLRGQPPRGPGLWALGGYAYMVVPDALWVLPALLGGELWPHEPWMDVFLGHVALDRWAYTSVLAVPVVLAAVGIWWGAGRARRSRRL